MEAILFALALALLLAAGCGLAFLLLPRDRPVSLSELVSLSILLGSGYISLSSFLAGLLVAGWPMRTLVAAGALTITLAGWYMRPGVTLALSPLRSWYDGVIACLLLLQFLIVVWASLRLALGFDGLFIWESKAQLIHQAGGVMPTDLFHGPAAQFPHPDYPLLLPLTESWFYGWMGVANQGMVKLVSPLFYLAITLMLLSAGVRRDRNRWRGVVPAVLFFFLPWAALRTTAGEADIPLAAFYLACVVYLLDAIECADSRRLLLVGVLGAVLPWVKREGTILWACLLAVVLILSVRRRDWRGLVSFAFPGLLWLGFWRAFLAFEHASFQPEYLPVTWSTLHSNIGRLRIIAAELSKELADWRHWSLTWLIPFAGIAEGLARRRQSTLAWLALILGPMLLYSSIYIFSSWQPFEEHITASLARLLLQLAPATLLGISLLSTGASQDAARPLDV